MTKKEILSILLDTKIIAIIRLDSSASVQEVAEAIHKGGIQAIEITLGTPNAFAEIEKLSAHPDILVGVGSVVDTKGAESAIKAGAQFIVTPTTKKAVIELAHQNGKPVLSGALTPTEVLQAYEWGADIIKLFPAATFGLPYFKAIRGPLPYIPIMPTGGVTVQNAAEWLANGAVCLGVGGTLVNKGLIESRQFEAITEIAKQLKEATDKA